MKKERYIREVVTSSGAKSLRIEIRAYDQTYRKNIVISDFDTPKDAMNFAKKLRDQKLTEMASGFSVSNFQTVGDIYQKSKELFPDRIKTVQRHDAFYRKAIKEYEAVSIEKITSADIQTSVNKYAKDHTREQTGHMLSVWRKIYKTAVMLNINIPDRTIPVKIPQCRPDQPRKKEISSEDLKVFLETLAGYNTASVEGAYQSKCIYYAIQIMRYCGLRPAECFALTKNDIFINQNGKSFISVNKAARSTADSMLEISDTKTKKSERQMPVPLALAPILSECIQWSRHEILLADYHGNLQSIDKVSDYVRFVAKKARVQFNLYQLRHQFSTDLIRCGVNPAVIRDLMGHESATMTLDYAVSYEDDRRQAIDKRVFS